MTIPNRYRAFASIGLRYLLGILIIWWLLNTELINLKVLQAIDSRLIASACALIVVQSMLAAWRVQLLLSKLGIYTGLLQCLAFNSLGVFYSLLLPGGMSGDLARAYCFWRAHPKASKSALFGALFVDRLLGTVAMVTMGLIGGSLLMNSLGLTRFVLICWGIFVVLALAYLVLTRLHAKTDKAAQGLFSNALRFVEKIDLRRYGAGVVALGSLLSMAGHLCAALVIYEASNLLQSGLNLMQVITVAPLGLLANAIPLTPGGLGIGEKGFELLYRAVGGTHGGNSFLVSRLFLFAPALLGALVLLCQFVGSHRLLLSLATKRQ